MFKKRTPVVGSIPGTLVVDATGVKPRICVIDYTADGVQQTEINDVEELVKFKAAKSVTWVDVQGLGDAAILKRISEIFELHPLTMADIVNVPSRPKAEDHADYLLIITIMVTMMKMPIVNTEQVSIVLGANFVLTFQENFTGDVMDPVRERIHHGRGPMRHHGSDYLAYAITDAIIDGYYPVVEELGEYLEELEEKIISDPDKNTLRAVYNVKRELMTLRRSIWPKREFLTVLIRDESKLIKKATRIYLRDCYDHCVQLIDVLETYRETCGSFIEVYMSSMSKKLNEVMKVLTIISTVFIPLSFLAGIFGMNFKYMPELEWQHGYLIFWIITLISGGGMLFFFYRLGWLDFDRENGLITKKTKD